MAKLGEFDFIDQFLKAQSAQAQSFHRQPHALGIGDDAALVPPAALGPDEQFVVSTDMLIEGRHYSANVDLRSLGHKVLAVNLSDLAAMGARPVGCTLAAALRSIDEAWLREFLEGFFALSKRFQCPLIGGDTTGLPANAPQVFSVTVMGAVPIGQALRRDGVRVGDDLWVSGRLGGPAYALSQESSHEKLNWPSPRLALGEQLRGIASAAIDVSDGLSSEIGHLLSASGAVYHQSGEFPALSAVMNWEAIALSRDLLSAVDAKQLDPTDARIFAVTGGDEYELAFTAPVQRREAILGLMQPLGLELTRIGSIQGSNSQQIVWQTADGVAIDRAAEARCQQPGFTHF